MWKDYFYEKNLTELLTTTMQAQLNILGKKHHASLLEPLDISLAVRFDGSDPNCFYAPLPEVSPVVAGNFIGSISAGGLVNFKTVTINPHGNGTHTECVGHIAKEVYNLSDCLKRFIFSGRLISIYPQRMDNGDRCITKDQLAAIIRPGEVEAIILRTMPNDASKICRQYSGTNPPYLEEAAAQLMVDCGINHLLLDLPSVDKEQDEGQLLAHKAFWQYPFDTRKHATITEMIYISPQIDDGLYLLQMQITSFVLDASPSKPVLYKLTKV